MPAPADAPAAEPPAAPPSASPAGPGDAPKKAGPKPGGETAQKKSLRVDAEKIEDLIRLVGELTIQNEILFQCKQEDNLASVTAADSVELIHRSIRSLQDVAFSFRLQPH